jgi:hypothetical protein
MKSKMGMIREEMILANCKHLRRRKRESVEQLISAII